MGTADKNLSVFNLAGHLLYAFSSAGSVRCLISRILVVYYLLIISYLDSFILYNLKYFIMYFHFKCLLYESLFVVDPNIDPNTVNTFVGGMQKMAEYQSPLAYQTRCVKIFSDSYVSSPSVFSFVCQYILI